MFNYAYSNFGRDRGVGYTSVRIFHEKMERLWDPMSQSIHTETVAVIIKRPII